MYCALGNFYSSRLMVCLPLSASRKWSIIAAFLAKGWQIYNCTMYIYEQTFLQTFFYTRFRLYKNSNMILNVLEICKKNVLSPMGPSHELEIFSFFVCDTGSSHLFVTNLSVCRTTQTVLCPDERTGSSSLSSWPADSASSPSSLCSPVNVSAVAPLQWTSGQHVVITSRRRQ